MLLTVFASLPLQPILTTAVDPGLGVMTGVIGSAGLAAVACALAWRSSLTAEAGERRAWRALAYGLGLWVGSGLLVLSFLAMREDSLSIPAWTQAGYLLAYPFWYRALWSLRQPAPADSRAHRAWTLIAEIVVLCLVGVVLGGLVWFDAVSAGTNISFLVPPILDVLLFGLFYNAVRRSGISGDGALAWMGYAFGAFALTDTLVTYAILREWVLLGAVVMPGYTVATGLLVFATLRRLRVAEAQSGLSISHSGVLAGGLALSALAMAIVSGPLQIAVGVASIFLAWRIFAAIRESGSSDLDTRSGFLSSPAFTRQLERAISSRQELTLIGIDLTAFGIWNARNGFSAGDEMLDRVSVSLDSAFSAGVWGRIGPDRFAHLGPAGTLTDDRNTADELRRRASVAAQELSARGGLVRLPEDADSAEQALAALEEALRAAREAERDVVAFGGGALDGVELKDGNATLADRRALVQELIDAPDTIRPVYQPIVRMADAEIVSFEGLSRFHASPNRGPDVWIAEAHAVGLGVDMELECVRRVVAGARSSAFPVHVSVNASPALVFSRSFASALGPGDLDWLTIEITEHDKVDNYSQLAERLSAFRSRGAAVAVDDAGAGHSSLRHVMQLRPEWIKLDRSLIQEIDNDPGKRALVRSMVAFNEEIGSHLIAEGVETKAEMDTLLQLGVEMAQGYFFARPDSEFVESIPPPWELAAN